MAAIASISNGEAMSSVRTKLNSVITEINLLDPTDWVDYSATSTIVGWSSRSTSVLRYRIIGKQIFVQFNLIGTSNSTSITFTLPFNCIQQTSIFAIAVDNGATTGAGLTQTTLNSNVVNCYSNAFGATWTSSGSKIIRGQFFYETA